MARSVNQILIRLSRWPRRIAALVCLLLAAASALVPADGADAHKHSPPRREAALRPGQVAVPVAVTTAQAAQFVTVGDRIGVLAGPDETTGISDPASSTTLLADGLRVLAVSPGDDLGATGPVLLVAADRAAAMRIAAVGSRPALVVLDKDP